MNQTFKKKQPLLNKLIPLILTVIAVALDQITKSIVVANLDELLKAEDFSKAIIPLIGNDTYTFLQLIHVRNPAIAFSMGASLSATVRSILFAALPLVIIILVFIVYFRNNDFTRLQRWTICGILGGGLGNLIDRFFRPGGVVDFIDCIFFGSFKWKHWPKTGFLSWNRWPTFNIADAFVVVCGIILVISFALQIAKEKKQKGREKNE